MQERFYRDWVKNYGGISFQAQIEETDLFISADSDIKDQALDCVKRQRALLKDYIKKDSSFLTSLEPIEVEPQAPLIIKEMTRAASIAGVGPMAAVAGAMAEIVGRELRELSENIIVENGGDIFIDTCRSSVVALYAGSSSMSGEIGLKLDQNIMPLGVCTSSATVGHSLNFGKADAVTVVSDSTAIADALATSISNMIKFSSDIDFALKYVQDISGIKGLIIVAAGKIAFYGDVEIVKL
ncbi:MAG: UPF0280 family protein [Candidatus Kaelpia aquatica]|nr:UPF0280 family protein [Candidatus Kaelpia aquatica]